MDACICMVESLHCSPETTTILLIGSTLKQKEKFKVLKKCTARTSNKIIY